MFQFALVSALVLAKEINGTLNFQVDITGQVVTIALVRSRKQLM